jgi:hypothetical protein
MVAAPQPATAEMPEFAGHDRGAGQWRPSRNNGAKSTGMLCPLWSVSALGQVNWAGPLPGSRPTYLTHEYLSRDQTCDLQELQVAPLAVPLFRNGQLG